MTSQRRQWQLDKLALGVCGNCGKNPLINRTRCEPCRDKNRAASSKSSAKARRRAREAAAKCS